MMTLLKYEILRRWKWLAFRYIALIGLGVVFYNRAAATPMQYEIAAASMGKFFLISLIVFVIILVEGINMLKEDLFEQSGYLTFTLPKPGRSILFAKNFLLLIQLILWVIVSIQFGSMFLKFLPLEEMSQFMSEIDLNIYPAILFFLSAFFNFVLMVQFSLTLTRTLLYRNKYSGIISVGIFFLLAYLIEQFYYGLFLVRVQHIYSEIAGEIQVDLISAGYSSVVMNIILSVIFFTATAYLLERKINI